MRSFRPVVSLIALVFVFTACGDDPPTENNTPPVADAGADVMSERGAAIQLDGSGSSDANDDELTYAWSFHSRPTGSAATIDNATQETASFVPDAVGTYVLVLTVADASGDSDTDEVAVTIEFPVIDESITADTVLLNSAAPAGEPDYVIPADHLISVDARLTIDPGVTIEMGENSRLQINQSGVIVADGAAALPIRFIGSTSAAGWHEGVRVASASVDNVFDHVEIAHGGRDGWANLWVDGAVALTNSTLRDSETYGLEVGGTLHDFGANQFADNAISGIRLGPDLIHWIDGASSVMTAGASQRIHVFDGDVLASQAWASDHAYWLEDFAWIRIYAALTIEPGFDLLVGDDGRVQVDIDGSLTATGTATDSIRFVGDEPVQGHWDGIHTDLGTNATLSFARVGYGGRIVANFFTNGTASVTHSHIHDSAGYGLQSSSSGTLTQSDNTFANNALGDVLIIE